MDPQFTALEKSLVKKIRIQMIVIGVLGLLLLTGIISYFSGKINVSLVQDKIDETKFHGSIHDKIALDGLKTFKRFAGPTELLFSQGVYYDSTDINKYMKDSLHVIIQRHDKFRNGPMPNINCVWRVGFYWMVKREPQKDPRLGFYVVPVMVDTLKKVVFDYFDPAGIFYRHPGEVTAKDDDDDGNNVFDEGHLWP